MLNTLSLSLSSCSTRFTFGIESKRQSWLAYPWRKVGTYASSRNAIAIYTPREMLSPIFYFPQSPSIPCQQPPMPRISAIHSMRIKLSSVEGPPCASQPPKRAGTNLVVWNASFSSSHGKEYKTAPLLPFRDTLLKNFKPAAPETAHQPPLYIPPLSPVTDSARLHIFSRMKFPSIGLTVVIEAPNF